VLSFDDEASARAALESEEWAAAVRHVGAMRGKRIALLGDEREMLGADR
jgi:L-fucose isomerase-like protein